MFALFSPLDKKLLRDLWRIKGQGGAIAFVIASGIALFVMSDGLLSSLQVTMDAYYERYRFAHAYANVTRAPAHTLEDLGRVEGVAAVEGRIAAGALVDIPTEAAPVTARVVSLPKFGRPRLNDIYLKAGRMPDPFRPDEAVVLESFALAHGMGAGDTLNVTMNGARRAFEIVGVAQSPEFIYTIPPGEFVPNDRRFAVIWMGYEALAAAYDLDGAFNEALIGFSRGAHEQHVLDHADRLLAPYGATGAYGRADQLSNKFLTEELKQLSTMGKILPPIFLAVAAFLLNIVITRIIQSEREEIGLMKAFGYANHEVGLHYLKFVMTIAMAGTLLGCGLGLWLGRFMAEMFQSIYKFPFLLFQAPMSTFAIAIGVSLSATALGVYVAVRRAVVLAPAVAMRPPAPPDYSRAMRLGDYLERHLDQPSRMVLRRLVRQPVRAGMTCLGIGAAMALSVTMHFNNDAIDYMLDVSFDVVDRSDVSVMFVEPQSYKTIYELKRVEGVIAVEPVRGAPVLMRNGLREHLGELSGLPQNAQLNRAVDDEMQTIFVRGDGVIVSEALAEVLAIEPGDELQLEVREGRRPELSLPVVGVAGTLIGAPAYIELSALNRALKEGALVSGANMQIDAARQDEIYAQLKDMPKVAGVSIRREAQKAFQKMVDEGPGTFRVIMTVFAILIAVGVVYNSARISFAERERDLASLRVLGFTKSETSYVLLGELAAVTIMALPVGAAMGYALSAYIADAFSTELYQIPMVLRASSFGYSALVVLTATVLSGYLVQRDVNKLDMVAALKTRE